MKTTSLSLACVYTFFCHTFVSCTVVKKNEYEDIKLNAPSHIVKLKSSNKTVGFEPTSLIKNHYETFKNMETSLQGKYDLKDLHSTAIKETQEPKTLKNVNIGKNFTAVVGSFDPLFVNYLSQQEDVEYIEPNQIYKAAIMPVTQKPQSYEGSHSYQKREMVTQENVPSWGLARINTRELNDLTSFSVNDEAGNDIHIYVLDSGISAGHPDFQGRASMDANFVSYEDDIDHAGHGTHVAGTVGGSIFGVAKGSRIHGVKILDRNGDGTTDALVQAISYIAQNAQPGRTIINLSLTGPRSQTIDDALSMAVRQHGIPVFASAGNSGDDACNYSPSANPDVFTVGATDNHDYIPSFSSYGSCVRVYAPGANITSTWIDNQSQIMDGTSMANPHVTGIAALLMSEFAFNSPFELYDAIVSLATQGVLEPTVEEERENLLAYYGPEH